VSLIQLNFFLLMDSIYNLEVFNLPCPTPLAQFEALDCFQMETNCIYHILIERAETVSPPARSQSTCNYLFFQCFAEPSPDFAVWHLFEEDCSDGCEAPSAVASEDARISFMATRLPVAVLFFLVIACGGESGPAPASQTVTGGVAERGRSILEANRHGCATCHVIPGVAGARGLVGPPLNAMGLRGYIAGRLPNQPENLIHWIAHPRSVDSQTAMPDTGISEDEARHVAAYLYTLRTVPR
jgi:cytochrome c